MNRCRHDCERLPLAGTSACEWHATASDYDDHLLWRHQRYGPGSEPSLDMPPDAPRESRFRRPMLDLTLMPEPGWETWTVRQIEPEPEPMPKPKPMPKRQPTRSAIRAQVSLQRARDRERKREIDDLRAWNLDREHRLAAVDRLLRVAERLLIATEPGRPRDPLPKAIEALALGREETVTSVAIDQIVDAVAEAGTIEREEALAIVRGVVGPRPPRRPRGGGRG